MTHTKKSVILMVVVLLAAPGIVWAEEDPIAPPTIKIPKSPAPKTETPPVKAPEPPTNGGADWSPPSTVARRELPADNLPAPLVRDPRTGSRLAGGTPSGSSSAGSSRTAAPRTVTVAPLLGTPSPSSTQGTPRITSTPIVAAGAQIESVAKVHNLPLPDQKLALRLDVTFALQGARGRAVYLEVDFQRMDTGETVRSTLPVYANPNGTLAVRTALSTVPVDMGRYAASVWVPYQAFPSPTEADMYIVTANVRLLRSEANQAPTVLANATTTFNVHAPAAAAPDKRELLPRAPSGLDAPLIDGGPADTGPLDIDVDPVEFDDPFAPPVAAGSPDGK